MTDETYIPGNPAASGRLVVISGCSGGGKSTLLEALTAKGYPTFPEPGRQIVREEAFVPTGALPSEDPVRFGLRCLDRAVHFYNSARPDPVAFFDRSIVDAAANLAQHGRPHAAHIARYRYAETVFLAPPWPDLFQSDAERTHGFDAARAEYDLLDTAYRHAGYCVTLLPKADIPTRVAFVERTLGL